MMFSLYWLISHNYEYTYVGFTDNLKRRVMEHRYGKIKTTQNFNGFRCFEIEKVDTIERAREREKYWKSHAGRKKLKQFFNKI